MPGSLPISEDLSELLSLLNSHEVEFLVVGAHALAFHGVPRFTEDIDIFVEKSRLNIERLASALEKFGVTVPENSRDQMATKERGVLFIGKKPNRADFLNFLDGLEFDTAARSALSGILADQPVRFLSLNDYIATKRASGRPKDQADLALLKTLYPDMDV